MSQTRRQLIKAVLASATLASSQLVHAQQQGQSTLKMWKDGDPGERLALRGRVVDNTGKPVANARVAMRQANGDASYTEQYTGTVFSDSNGEFRVLTAVPGQYTSAKHIHIHVYAEQHTALNTEILFKGDPNIDLGINDGIEVLLEKSGGGEQATNVGTVEIVMQRLGG